MNKKLKIWIIFSLIVVFFAGFSGGILLDKVFKPQSRSKARRPHVFPSIEKIAEELGLTPDQQTQIQEIFNQNDERLRILRRQIHDQFSSLRSQLKSELSDILDESQQNKLREMIEKYSSRKQDGRDHPPKSHQNRSHKKGDKK